MKMKFKKFLAVSVAVVIILTAAPLSGFVGLELPGLFNLFASAESYSGTCGENLTWSFNEEAGALVISGTGEMTNFNGREAPWYNYAPYITTVTIANGITSIGSYAFNSCENLTSITIPDSVTDIGSGAFSYCTSLTSIAIPNRVQRIWFDTFLYCEALADITLPYQVNYIDASAFYGCFNLKNLSFKYHTSSPVEYYNNNFIIENGVLYDRSKTRLICYPSALELTEYTVPSTVDEVEWSLFYRVKNLEVLTIPETVTTINIYNNRNIDVPDQTSYFEESFKIAECENLKSLTFSATVENIPVQIINCNAMTDVTVNSNMDTFEFGAVNCEELSQINVSESVENLELYLYDCDAITQAKLNDSIIDATISINGCDSLESVSYGDGLENLYLSIGENCPLLKEITIPDEVLNPVISISSDYVETLNLGKTVKTYRTFSHEPNEQNSFWIPNLKEITISKDNSYIGLDGDCVYDKHTKELLAIPVGEGVVDLVIPDYIKTIDAGSTCFCKSLKSVVVGAGIVEIPEGCFSVHETLESISFRGKVSKIGDYAFSECIGLKNVNLPFGLEEIGAYAFSDCRTIDTLFIPKSITTVGENAFINTRVKKVNFEGTIKEWHAHPVCSKINGDALVTCDYVDSSLEYTVIDSGACGENLTWVLYDDGELVISGTGELRNYDYSSSVPWYSYRSSIEKVTIKDGVTSIGDYAFYDCDNLTNITVPDSVTSIGNYAFYGCDRFTRITLSDSVTNIGRGAFMWCIALTLVRIPESVTSLGASVFHGCTALVNITVDDANIAYSSDEYGILFDKNKTVLIKSPSKNEITNYTIPDSVTTICDYAFYDCESLTSITIPASVASVGDDAFYNCDSLTLTYYPGTKEQWKEIEIGEGNYDLTRKIVYECNSDRPKYDSGTCGDNLAWVLYADGELVISGTGAMDDFDDFEPWIDHSSDIKVVTIMEGVTSIGNHAFGANTNNGDYYDNLNTVVLPDSLKTIGNYAFYYCENLSNVVIPENVMSIGERAFSNCENLKSITVDEANTVYLSDENGILFNKDKTELIQYPAGIDVFAYTVPESVNAIGVGAFEGCDKLESVTLPVGIDSIGSIAFLGCSKLKAVYYPGTLEQWNKVEVDEYNDQLNGILVLESNSEKPYRSGSCGESLFWSLYEDGEFVISGTGDMYDYGSVYDVPWSMYQFKIRKLTIKEGVTSLDSTVITELMYLENITVHSDNPSYVSDENGVLYNKDKTELVMIPYNGTYSNFTIPASVKNEEAVDLLRKAALSDIKRFTVKEGSQLFTSDEFGVLYNKDKTELICYPSSSDMTSFTVPGTVKSFDGLFGADNLEELVVSEGVEELPYGILFCDSLKEVTIPSTLNKLDNTYQFIGCKKLEKIIVAEENPFFSSDEYGVLYDKDKTLLIYIPPKGIGDSYVIPETVTEVLDFAFIDCRDFSLTLSDSLENYSFLSTVSAKEFIVKESNPEIIAIDGVIYDKEVTGVVKYPVDSDRQIFILPESVDLSKHSEFAFYSLNSNSFVFFYLSAYFIFEYIGLSEYSFYNAPETLTIHSQNWTESGVEGLLGVSHVYIDGVEQSTVDHFNEIVEEYVEGIKTDCESILEQFDKAFDEDSKFLKVYISYLEWCYNLPTFAVCNGDHTQLHPEVIEREHVDKTCTTDGYVIYYCSDCDKEYRVDFKAEGHNYTMEETQPTCTTAGKKVYTCDCGDAYTETLPALGHNPEYFRVEPTCTQEGYECYKCTLCGTEYAREAIPVTPHNHVVTGETPATCTTAGVKIYTCECGDTYTEKIPALGHNPEDYRTEPTCTEDGYACYKCTVCSTEYAKQTIPATGHSYDEEIITESTCTEEGLKRYTCSVCDDSYEEKMPLADHTITTIRKEPTCTSIGNEQYLCEVCGNMIGDMVILPKLPHAYGEWTVVSAPTATEDGSKSHCCISCGKAETIAITATGFETADGVTIDFTTNIISGLNSGETTLDGYTTIVADGFVWSYETQNGRLGTASKAILKDGDTVIGEYTILIYGDTTGDSWYDGQDAIIVDCLANGMLTQEDVGETVYIAADCNHDGVIDQLDVDLLNQAGTLLANVDQSKPAEVLLETSSEYVEYLDLIDQTPEVEVEDDEATENEATEDESDDSAPVVENSIFAFFFEFIAIFEKLFNFILSFVNV